MALRGCLNRHFAPQSAIGKIFAGPHGVYAGWRAILFAALLAVQCVVYASLAVYILHHTGHHAQKLPPHLTPVFLLSNEPILLVPALLSTWVLAVLEDVPFLAYGLGGPRKVARLLGGAAIGLAAISLLVLILVLTGYGFPLAGSLTPAGDLRYGLEWAGVSLLIGLTEEFLFRGYLYKTLVRGAGFWPAAIITSLIFGAAHGHNHGETMVGLVMIAAIGIVLCLTIRATNSLWFAIGLHGAWDYGENFVFGTHDSGNSCYGTLMDFTPRGNIYLSGGLTGPEGSIFSLVVVALMAAVLWKMFSANQQHRAKT